MGKLRLQVTPGSGKAVIQGSELSCLPRGTFPLGQALALHSRPCAWQEAGLGSQAAGAARQHLRGDCCLRVSLREPPGLWAYAWTEQVFRWAPEDASVPRAAAFRSQSSQPGKVASCLGCQQGGYYYGWWLGRGSKLGGVERKKAAEGWE